MLNSLSRVHKNDESFFPRYKYKRDRNIPRAPHPPPLPHQKKTIASNGNKFRPVERIISVFTAKELSWETPLNTSILAPNPSSIKQIQVECHTTPDF